MYLASVPFDKRIVIGLALVLCSKRTLSPPIVVSLLPLKIFYYVFPTFEALLDFFSSSY